jgi:hypothetical protein
VIRRELSRLGPVRLFVLDRLAVDHRHGRSHRVRGLVFSLQVDWHMLAYSTTDGKGFSYPLMLWINPIYALAYIIALIAAIPYWRYLGLIG